VLLEVVHNLILGLASITTIIGLAKGIVSIGTRCLETCGDVDRLAEML
jgi:hypothetical protein